MQYIDQYADQLRLNVIKGSVPHNQVEILCSAELSTKTGSINAHIIGASHFFEYKNKKGTVILSEIFACQKINTPTSLFYGSLNKSNHYQTSIVGIDYSFSAQQITWDDGVLASFKTDHETNTVGKDIFLQFSFPNKDENMAKLAVTLLSIKNIENIIQVDSLHAYPKEEQFVISQTILS